MGLKETYNRIAEDWHRDHLQDDWWFEGADTLTSFLKNGDLVLDIGCAGGTKSAYLMKKGLKVIGIDLSENMIEIAKREAPHGTFFVFDLDEVDRLDYLFDGIFMQAVLLHVPKKEVSDKLKRIVSKLKAGGYILVAVKEKWPQGADEEIKIENDYGYPYERFFSYFGIDEIRAHMQQAGLEIVFSNITLSGNTNWIEVIGKKQKEA